MRSEGAKDFFLFHYVTDYPTKADETNLKAVLPCKRLGDRLASKILNMEKMRGE